MVEYNNQKNSAGGVREITILVVIIFIVMVSAFTTGIYFKEDLFNFYKISSEQVIKEIENLQNSDISDIITQKGRDVFSPPPLNAGGSKNDVVLLKSQIIFETNLQRAANGDLPPLIENQKLNEAAAAKANDMFLNQYFEHISPVGVGPGDLVQKYNYEYIVTGENLILGNFSSEKEVVQDWMDSPKHKENILNSRYTEIGVAVVRGTYKGETVWMGVQEFGLPISSCPEPSLELKKQIESEKVRLDMMYESINSERDQIEKADNSSAAYGQMIDDYNELVKEYNSLSESYKVNVAEYNRQVTIFNDCVAGK